MNKLPIEKRVQVLNMLVEGSSMRSIERVVGVNINTVTKLLVDAGKVAAEFHNEAVRDVAARHVQCDEIWELLLLQAEERRARLWGDRRSGRRMDVDGNRQRHEADRLLAGGRPRLRVRAGLHGRPTVPADEPGTAIDRRAQGVPRGRRGRFRDRCGLRDAYQALRPTCGRGRTAALLSGPVRWGSAGLRLR